jgi:hypothetical protein
MANTPNLDLPVIASDQAQKHVTHNESLLVMDALIQLVVVSTAVTSPPASPDEGVCYAVGASATGDWAGQDANVAIMIGGAWTFVAPKTGWLAYNEASMTHVKFDGSAWVLAF